MSQVAENEEKRHEGAPDKATVILLILDKLSPILKIAIIWPCVTVMFWFAMDSLQAFAGKNSTAEVSLEYLTGSPSGLSVTISISLSLAFAGWAIRERRLRRETVARMHGRIKELELLLDPNRTSSQLTTKGMTNPADI